MMLASALVLPAWGVEPPLPGEDGPARPGRDFEPLLEPGDHLPPEAEAPVLPDGPAVLPPELFPGAMPGSDGVDGLPLPDDVPGSGLLPPGTEGEGTAPFLPPPVEAPTVPGMELAARAYWHKSPREAKAEAVRDRKPMLIFFRQKWKSAPMPSLSGNSGDNNIALNDDLLATPEFNEFAAGRVVLTSLFYPIGSLNEKEFPPEKLAALQQFKDFYDVKGFPWIILLDEKGRVIERVKGYTRVSNGRGLMLSTAQPILERLRLAVERREAVIAAEDERLARLMAQDYREWTNVEGMKLMAKLVSANSAEVVLRDDAGALRRVPPAHLSIIDQAWIHRQQKGKQQALK